MYALVIVEYSLKKLDKTFIYHIPKVMENELKVGMKVLVPFGHQNIYGFVLAIQNYLEEPMEIKDIIEIADPELVLSSELLKIADFLCEETLCTKISALQTLLPSSFKAKSQKSNYNQYETYIYLNQDKDIKQYKEENKRSKKQIEIIELLETKGKIKKKEIGSNSSLNGLIKKDIVRQENVQIYRINKQEKKEQEKKLTLEQQKVFQEVKDSLNKYQTFLLYGITGSGKTEVYIKLIKEVIKQGKTALMLVPEILLTMQIVKRFYAEFGADVAILHSALSSGEKHDEYLKIMRQEVKIVVGTRSAVFAPLKNLGLIIIDEEHSGTYKQDNMPRYNAKDVATFRAKENNIPLLLGSATPTLEAMARAQKQVFKLLTLDKRIGEAQLPIVHIVDMALEMKNRHNIISEILYTKIKERLINNEQVILLLNRRGFATFINCSNCGFTYKCPNCDISLTYHKSSNNLICHYCGYQIKKADSCPNCGEDALNFLGLGTEKLEEHLKKIFPMAKIARMDQDTTTKKGAHEAFIEAFLAEKYNILIGTQMVSKGLDFPKVTLVGIINADTTLNIPDFRANENTFDLLNQVAGRSGRSTRLGEVIVQTFNPDNFIMDCVKNSNYLNFYNQEMLIRKHLKYPPYYYLVGLKVKGKDYAKTLEEAKKIKKYVEQRVEKETICLGPTTALILKFNNEYRFQIMIKYRFDTKLKKVLKEIDMMYNENKAIFLEIDLNPTRI